MLVFTVFHEQTKSWFVVSSEESLERSWSILVDSVSKAHNGPLVEHVQQHGDQGYKLEVWGEADTGSEARELLRDAQQELSALVQGMPRKEAKETKKASTGGLSLDQFKELLSEAGSDAPVAKQPEKPKAAQKPGSDGGRDEMHQVMVAIEARRLSMKKSAADKRRAEARQTARSSRARAKAAKAATPVATNDPQMDELLARLDARAANVTRRS